MQILFLHPNFPAQFRDLAVELARDPNNTVLFGTTRKAGELPGVRKVLYEPSRSPKSETHFYVRNLEQAVLHGQAAARMGLSLKNEGFRPDVIYGHCGWGPALFMKDIFPGVPLLGHFEWFYQAHGSDSDFDPADPLSLDEEARIRVKNATLLLELLACDRGSTSTAFQHTRFPPEFQEKIDVLHEGIDTDYFAPKPGPLLLPRIGLDLSGAKEIVTYVGRGMEPYRGFPQFIEALHESLQARPQCHAVVVGQDRVVYGRQLPEGESWKQRMLERCALDPARVHFTGPLPYSEYLQVLQASAAHVYLTRPFVLSWSMLEAMSAGCLLVASDTAPVREVVQDGVNGLLVDFFSPEKIAQRIAEALDHASEMQVIRSAARATIIDRYSHHEALPRRVNWVREFART